MRIFSGLILLSLLFTVLSCEGDPNIGGDPNLCYSTLNNTAPVYMRFNVCIKDNLGNEYTYSTGGNQSLIIGLPKSRCYSIQFAQQPHEPSGPGTSSIIVVTWSVLDWLTYSTGYTTGSVRPAICGAYDEYSFCLGNDCSN